MEIKLYKRNNVYLGEATIPDARAFPDLVSIQECDKNPKEGGVHHTTYFKRQSDDKLCDLFEEVEIVPAVIVETI